MSDDSNEPDDLIGTECHGYQLERRLGDGGAAAVYQASHALWPERKVAVKLLLPDWTRSADVRRRFEIEAKVSASLDHEHIIKCLDYGFTNQGNPFLIVELLEGDDLFRRLESRRRLSLDELIPIANQVASALEAVHAKGIIHRDIKPENIFLARTPEGGETVKVLDFGIARVVGTERYTTGIVGTPYYLAPEQIKGRYAEVDARCDLFSFAAMVYHCLTGSRP